MTSENFDTTTVPSEVKIYYSKKKLLGQLLISVLVTLSGIVTVYWDLKFYIGYIIIVAGIYMMYQYLSKLPLTLPTIVLNEKGITSSAYGYFDWHSIATVYVVRRREWRSYNDYLVVITNNTYEILIDDLDVSFETLENYLEVYRNKNKKRNSKHL